MTDATFSEQSLGEAIKQTWGEYGAHYDVWTEVLRRAYALDEAHERAERAEQVLQRLVDLQDGITWKAAREVLAARTDTGSGE